MHKNFGKNQWDDDDEDDYQSPAAFHVSVVETEEGPRIFNLFLYGLIKSPEQVIPFVKALQVAGEDDIVMFHLHSAGGDIDTTDTLLLALNMTKARVIHVASGGVHSAGTLLLMHADEVIFSDGFNALIHNGSVGMGSKYSDWKSAAMFTMKHMEGLMASAYAGFLSDEEVQQMLAGQDLWFDKEDFATRLKARRGLIEATA